ncbi:hypothetical protein TI39_contig476g00009 [Zymoseptoria brevis]|uniref:Uncharacterized protein n=1 Tax=Zymoseptoria brevis TaxID=1047168 RepID=A0A0F4GK28_9PEZI|nr:hypothetical protein TI39_contig476g00009 [Zymoseptoria brevis]
MSSSKRPRKDDDDNDGTYSPPPAAKLRRISSRSSQFDSQLSDVSDKHSTAKRTLSKTTVPVRGEYWDRNLTQLSKIMKLLKDLNIDERSVLRVDSLLEKTLDSFFDVDLPSGKAAAQLWVAQKSKGTQGGLPVPTFTSKAVKDGRKRWTLVLNGPNRSKINLNFTEDDIVDFENMAWLGFLALKICRLWTEEAGGKHTYDSTVRYDII